MSAAEIELAILVARGVVAAASAIYKAIAGDEDPADLLARAAEAGVALPVRVGPGGTWEADLGERLARGARPSLVPAPPSIHERDTEPGLTVPPSPFGEDN